jgi:hypothetical protein
VKIAKIIIASPFQGQISVNNEIDAGTIPAAKDAGKMIATENK